MADPRNEAATFPSAAIDISTPSIARAYDYPLGGSDNYEVDRALLRQLDQTVPEVRSIAITRVRFLSLEAGIEQVLDCGSGLPTSENTHQIAQRRYADARVVYVDNDPVVVAHGRALLEESKSSFFLDDELVRTQLDFTRPLALLQVATLHHHHSVDFGTPPTEVMKAYIDALPSGSFVAFSHFFDPKNKHSAIARRVQNILDNSLSKGFFRTRAEIMAVLDGLELVDPGLVVNDGWWPDGPRLGELSAAGHCIVGAAGRKP